jgi:hypothetical protein
MSNSAVEELVSQLRKLGVTDPVESSVDDEESAEESQDLPRTVRWAIEQMLNRIDTLEDEFPVPFEVARRIAGYTKKSNATRALVKSFQEGRDYILITPTRRAGSAGRPSKWYALTGKAFKKFVLGLRPTRARSPWHTSSRWMNSSGVTGARHANVGSDEEWFAICANHCEAAKFTRRLNSINMAALGGDNAAECERQHSVKQHHRDWLSTRDRMTTGQRSAVEVTQSAMVGAVNKGKITNEAEWEGCKRICKATEKMAKVTGMHNDSDSESLPTQPRRKCLQVEDATQQAQQQTAPFPEPKQRIANGPSVGTQHHVPLRHSQPDHGWCHCPK